MKVLLVSTNDLQGGASRAANRLHKALLSLSVDSQILVGNKQSDDWRVLGPQSMLQKVLARLRPRIDRLPTKLQRTGNPFPHSPAWISGLKASQINACDADVINLHWVCGGLLSVEEIGRISKPLVWTLHDMWPLCGAEHYNDDGPTARWRAGYIVDNRPEDHSGFDIDRWVWNRKHRSWRFSMHLIAPSQWLGDCIRGSVLTQNWPVSVVPNPLDTRQFQPWPKALARQVFNLPKEVPLVLFGAIGGSSDLRKGWDFLQAALGKLTAQVPEVEGVIFGQSEPYDPPRLGLPLHWMGHLHDESSLSLLYSAADVMVVPSRQENLPQSGTEAQACGCPVVAFNVSGLPSVIIHQETGYLAEPFDIDDLAAGIVWTLASPDHYRRLSTQSRERALRLWSPHVVAPQYLNVYQQAIERRKLLFM